MTGESGELDSLADPATLREKDGVPVADVERTLEVEAFENLREFYDAVAGVVQVGITTDDGALLLQGSETTGEWAPPGGPVRPGEDWVEAARRQMETQTGTDIDIDGVELCEELTFRREDDPETSFTAVGVSFSASPGADDPGFLDDPDIVAHPHLPEDHDQTFAWFEGVPDDANDNHVEHIERFLD